MTVQQDEASIRALRKVWQYQRNRTHIWHYQPKPLSMDCPKKETGSLQHRTKGGNHTRIDKEELCRYVAEHPDAYQYEIARHLGCPRQHQLSVQDTGHHA